MNEFTFNQYNHMNKNCIDGLIFSVHMNNYIVFLYLRGFQ